MNNDYFIKSSKMYRILDNCSTQEGRERFDLPVMVDMRVMKLSPHSGTFRVSMSAMFLY